MSAPIVMFRGVSVRAAPWETQVERPRRPDPAPTVIATPAPGECIVPGCGRKIRADNHQGVCRNHAHARGYCKCVQCQRRTT